jgi:hypothetical protein
MYEKAGKIFRNEGGCNELGMANVKVYSFVDNLISRIVSKTGASGNPKMHILARPRPSSNPTKSLGKPQRHPILLKVELYPLLYPHRHNSGPFSPMNRLISSLSNAASPACKINANASWDP